MRIHRPARPRHAAPLALGVVAALALAGCTGGGDEPPATSTTSATTPSSTTTSITATTSTTTATSTGMPDAAKQNTKAGAEAFVRYFFDAQAKAWQTPDDGVLKALCLPTTSTCTGFQEVAQDLVRSNHRFDARPIVVESVRALAEPSPSVVVQMNGRQTAAREVDAAGKVYYTNPTASLNLAFTLGRSGNGWIVQKIQKAG